MCMYLWKTYLYNFVYIYMCVLYEGIETYKSSLAGSGWCNTTVYYCIAVSL